MKIFKTFAVILTVLFFSQFAIANDKCKISIDSTDAMTFTTESFEISKSCDEFEITLVHVGKLPINVMGHNIVITKTSDYQAAAIAGMSSGLDNNYVAPNDKKVLAYTKVIGGGESVTIKVKSSLFEKGGDYTFFCSFPGHFSMMKGKIVIID